MTTSTGIDKISFYTPAYYLDLNDLAERDGIDPAKYHSGIGQERFAVPPHDEDIITMGANAASAILDDSDRAAIDTIMLATESSVDQSKAGAVYIQHLLGLSPHCRAFELKQACYSATAGLQLACAYVATHPNKKVLLIASDISRYDQHTPAEATQGAAAVAMLISTNPRTAVLNPISGQYIEDVMDFWRPNHRHTPLVDGKLSTQIYLKATQNAWQHYYDQGGIAFADIAAHCYHLPFSKMGIKAHQRLCKHTGVAEIAEQTAAGMKYNRDIGNSYTASLYLSLISTLDYRDDLAGKTIGMLSYGSGAVAEYFTLTVTNDYQAHRFTERHQALIANRERLDLETYNYFWHRPEHTPEEHTVLEHKNHSRYRLAEIIGYERKYVVG